MNVMSLLLMISLILFNIFYCRLLVLILNIIETLVSKLVYIPWKICTLSWLEMTVEYLLPFLDELDMFIDKK